jgi:hypothetical protein
MSNSHNAKTAAEVAMGVVNQLARQGGVNTHLQSHGVMKVGELLVKGAATVAPGAVVVASAGTAGVISATSAAVVALTPFAVVAAAGYGAYKLYEWIDDK